MLSFLTMVSFFFTADLRVAFALVLTLALTALALCTNCYLEALAVEFLEALAVVFLAATLLTFAVELLVLFASF